MAGNTYKQTCSEIHKQSLGIKPSRPLPNFTRQQCTVSELHSADEAKQPTSTTRKRPHTSASGRPPVGGARRPTCCGAPGPLRYQPSLYSGWRCCTCRPRLGRVPYTTPHTGHVVRPRWIAMWCENEPGVKSRLHIGHRIRPSRSGGAATGLTSTGQERNLSRRAALDTCRPPSQLGRTAAGTGAGRQSENGSTERQRREHD